MRYSKGFYCHEGEMEDRYVFILLHKITENENKIKCCFMVVFEIKNGNFKAKIILAVLQICCLQCV